MSLLNHGRPRRGTYLCPWGYFGHGGSFWRGLGSQRQRVAFGSLATCCPTKLAGVGVTGAGVGSLEVVIRRHWEVTAAGGRELPALGNTIRAS